jgi:hypothetical protein
MIKRYNLKLTDERIDDFRNTITEIVEIEKENLSEHSPKQKSLEFD